MRRLPTHRPPTHPGEVLLEEFLKPWNLTQLAFAKHIGWNNTKLSDLINEKRGITPEMALDLEDVLGASAEFWLNLQANYDLWYALRAHQIKPRLPMAG